MRLVRNRFFSCSFCVGVSVCKTDGSYCLLTAMKERIDSLKVWNSSMRLISVFRTSIVVLIQICNVS